jgi:hypothetical protein
MKRPYSDSQRPGAKKSFKKSTEYKVQTNFRRIKRSIANVLELKEVYPNAGAAALSTSGTVTYMSGIPQGTEINQRVGRTINYHSVVIDVAVNPNALSTAPPGNGFWAIVLDRQPNGALATFGDIFDLANGLGDPAFCHRNTIRYADRFVVLIRADFASGQQTATLNGYQCKEYIHLASRLRGEDVKSKYQGTSALISDAATGALLFVSCLSNQSAFNGGGINPPQITWNSKLRYTDP